MQSVASSHRMQYAAQGLTFGKVALRMILAGGETPSAGYLPFER